MKWLQAIHYAKKDEAAQGLELLQKHFAHDVFWTYMHNASRMPGGVQSSWTRQPYADGAPVTASALESLNKSLKKAFKDVSVNEHSSCVTLSRFLLNVDTKSFKSMPDGSPRILAAYFIDRRAEKLLSWTGGIALRDLLVATAAFQVDGKPKYWVLYQERPVTFGEVERAHAASTESYAGWERWQEFRFFSCDMCTCPQQQLTDFCKHRAAAIAFQNGLFAPPSEVVSLRQWVRKLSAFRRVSNPIENMVPTIQSGVPPLARGIIDNRRAAGVLARAASALPPRGRSAKRSRTPIQRSPLKAISSNRAHRQPPSPRAVQERVWMRENAVRAESSSVQVMPNSRVKSHRTASAQLRSPSPCPVPPELTDCSEMVREVKLRVRSQSKGFVNQ